MMASCNCGGKQLRKDSQIVRQHGSDQDKRAHAQSGQRNRAAVVSPDSAMHVRWGEGREGRGESDAGARREGREGAETRRPDNGAARRTMCENQQ